MRLHDSVGLGVSTYRSVDMVTPCSSLSVLVLTGLAVSQVANFATTVYLHRTLSHRAIAMSPALSLGFRFLLLDHHWYRRPGSVYTHRKHHAHTDTDQDPHSPCASVGFGAADQRWRSTRVARRPRGAPALRQGPAANRWDGVLIDHSPGPRHRHGVLVLVLRMVGRTPTPASTPGYTC